MGRGVLINGRYQEHQPFTIISGATLQPGWERYIERPITSASARCRGGQSSTGQCSAKAWSDNMGWDEDQTSGTLSASVRVNFLPNMVGKTLYATWTCESSARWGSFPVSVYTAKLTLASGQRNVNGSREFVFVDGSSYLIISAYADFSTSRWAPSATATLHTLMIL